MRKLFLFIVTCLIFFVAPFGFAKNKDINTINLYDAPHAGAKVVAKINPSHRLIPIFRQKGWIKVGNPINGNIGWVNKKEYHQALNKLIKQQNKISSTYVQVTSNNGKETITAYENGKKLNKMQAKKLYKKMRHQQQLERRHFHRMWKRWHRYFNQNMFDMNNEMLPMQPMIVVVNEKK
ncbi:MAG: SH3 domain-containing protein [Gammaproteobacteria bacterium]|nr:SH3 domain-containing protein [Gammaproteobacteria bacterium]